MSNVRVQFSFIGTAAQFTTANRVLLAGEGGYETDTGLIKIGDGVTAWNSLPYWTAGIAAVLSVNGQTGVVTLTKADVSLGNADNTSDANKPVSTAQALADAAVQSFSIQRANHTGTQAASTISDFSTAADVRVGVGITSHVSSVDPHPQYAETGDLLAVQNYAIQRANHTGTQSAATITGLAAVATSGLKADIGLGNVDNTSDVNKPVSSAQSAAISQKVAQTGDTMFGPLVMEGDFSGTGHVNLKSQGSEPNMPASGVSIYANVNEMFSFRGQSSYSVALNEQSLTSDRQINIPDVDGDLLVDPTTTLGDIITRGASGLQRLGTGGPANVDYLLSVDSSGEPIWREENLGQDFGGGSDGSATITSTVTLLNPGYYDVLTMNHGGSIIMNGYPLYAKILDISNCDAGCIRWNGNNGSSTATQTGGAAGTALAVAMLGGSLIGGAGATSAVGSVGAIGTAGTQASPSNGGASGASGAGGAGSAGAGGALRAGAAALNFIEFDRFEQGFFRGAALIVGGAGGSGGGSGAGSVGTGRGGGGGGSGGGVVAVYAQTIITSALTPAGAIQSLGGNGGSSTGTPAADAGGGGGGGGAGGGYVYLAYLERSGPVVTNLIKANGGNGGNGGVGSSGASVAGNGGSGGTGGRIRVYNALTATSTFVVGGAGSSGTAAAGIVPGVGGAGGLAQISL